jgi:catechol 2,3-dioxygenase-like lactoylglutathione lyase family enzyme
MLQFFQVALVTPDMPGILRFYSEAFDFRNAGAQASWGSKIQGLGPDSRLIMWWMVGAQKFFQMEMFNYAHPEVRTLPADWRPCDHGWTRFGIVVADYERCLEVCKRNNVKPLGPEIVKNGRRHMAIREPYSGVVVEVIESNPARLEGPTVTYATHSVADLSSARHFYGEVLELEILPLDQLHSPGDEALWGLPGAAREGFLAEVDDVFLEVVQYSAPLGRPARQDWRLSDQGIMNVALGSRHPAPVARALDRLKEAGYEPPFRLENGENVCGYITHRERSLELASLPEAMDDVLGFTPAPINFMANRVKT